MERRRPRATLRATKQTAQGGAQKPTKRSGAMASGKQMRRARPQADEAEAKLRQLVEEISRTREELREEIHKREEAIVVCKDKAEALEKSEMARRKLKATNKKLSETLAASDSASKETAAKHQRDLEQLQKSLDLVEAGVVKRSHRSLELLGHVASDTEIVQSIVLDHPHQRHDDLRVYFTRTAKNLSDLNQLYQMGSNPTATTTRSDATRMPIPVPVCARCVVSDGISDDDLTRVQAELDKIRLSRDAADANPRDPDGKAGRSEDLGSEASHPSMHLTSRCSHLASRCSHLESAVREAEAENAMLRARDQSHRDTIAALERRVADQRNDIRETLQVVRELLPRQSHPSASDLDGGDGGSGMGMGNGKGTAAPRKSAHAVMAEEMDQLDGEINALEMSLAKFPRR